jgi:signal transduction histidine kinase
VYPAAFTAVGIGGNAYVLGAQITDLKEDIHQIKEEVRLIEDILRKVQDDIKGVLRQNELEAHDMALIQKLVMDCNKRR